MFHHLDAPASDGVLEKRRFAEAYKYAAGVRFGTTAGKPFSFLCQNHRRGDGRSAFVQTTVEMKQAYTVEEVILGAVVPIGS